MPTIQLSADDFSQKVASSSVQEAVDSLLKDRSILIFSKSYCPYTPVVESLLSEELQCTVHVLEINGIPQCEAIQNYLKTKTSHTTVPQVFLEGSFLGVHDDVVSMDQKGELASKVQKYMQGPRQPKTAPVGPQPLFFFPSTVNKWAIRATGLLSSGVSAGLAYSMLHHRDHPYVGLASAALLGDYTLRLIAGGKISPLSKLGTAMADAVQEPVPRPGAPKQFASFCGVMFSGLGYAFYASGNPTLAGGFLSVLAVCAGMESLLDFCLGCEFFHIGESIYKAFNTKDKKA